jgi:hypothetical protein
VMQKRLQSVMLREVECVSDAGVHDQWCWEKLSALVSEVKWQHRSEPGYIHAQTRAMSFRCTLIQFHILLPSLSCTHKHTHIHTLTQIQTDVLIHTWTVFCASSSWLLTSSSLSCNKDISAPCNAAVSACVPDHYTPNTQTLCSVSKIKGRDQWILHCKQTHAKGVEVHTVRTKDTHTHMCGRNFTRAHTHTHTHTNNTRMQKHTNTGKRNAAVATWRELRCGWARTHIHTHLHTH